MQTYKKELLQLLTRLGWELVEITKSDEWWVDEFWRIESRRNAWGLEVILSFLVDPMWDGPGEKRNSVWAISATDAIPPDRLAAEDGIAELCLVKGRFDEKLLEFGLALDGHRNSRE